MPHSSSSRSKLKRPSEPDLGSNSWVKADSKPTMSFEGRYQKYFDRNYYLYEEKFYLGKYKDLYSVVNPWQIYITNSNSNQGHI